MRDLSGLHAVSARRNPYIRLGVRYDRTGDANDPPQSMVEIGKPERVTLTAKTPRDAVREALRRYGVGYNTCKFWMGPAGFEPALDPL